MSEVVLGLDVGDARIGVARAEVGAGPPFGRGAVERRGTREDVDAIAGLAASEGATCVVIGLPRRTDGADSPQTRRVRAFATALAGEGLRVELEDERFTTVVAHQRLRESSTRRRRREKGRVDEEAAILILESYLARRSRSDPQPEIAADVADADAGVERP